MRHFPCVLNIVSLNIFWFGFSLNNHLQNWIAFIFSHVIHVLIGDCHLQGAI